MPPLVVEHTRIWKYQVHDLDQILTKPVENPVKSRTRLYAPINGFSLEKGCFQGFYGEGEKVAD